MAELIIKIGAESRQFQEELDRIKKKTEDLEGQLSTIAKISGLAFAALTAEAALAAKAFEESEKASRKLSVALENQGLNSEELTKAYKEQAKELQKLTGIDDDAIIASQAIVQGLIGQQEITLDLTKAIADLSAGRDIDLQSAAEYIAKGIDGQTVALKKLGIEIDDNLSKQERTAQIIERVNQAYGGQAEAANQGLGSIRGLNAAFSDLQENIGARLAPVLEKVIKGLTSFVQTISENDALIDLAVSVGVAAAAITGFITLLAGLGIAIISAQAVIAALNATFVGLELTLAAVAAPMLAVVAAVAALGAGLAYLALQSAKPVDPLKEVNDQIVSTEKQLAKFQERLTKPHHGFFDPDAPKKVEELKGKLEDLFETRRRIESQSQKFEDPAKVNAARKRAEEEKQIEDAKLAANRLHLEAMTLQRQGASTQMIEIIKQEMAIQKQLGTELRASEREELQLHLQEVQAIRLSVEEQELERRITFEEEILAQNEEFQALEDEQQQEFLAQNQAALMSQVETQKSIEQQHALERAQRQIAENNRYLSEHKKFGVAYAEISRIMNSEQIAGAKALFGELAALQTSGNSTLKSIGKAAAVANIIIKTAEGALSAYAGAITFFGPVFGPPIGLAAAAALTAFGAEQTGKVLAAQTGGIVTGGVAGRDSVPSLLTPGELIVPVQNFDEVVGAVSQARQEGGGPTGPTDITATVVLELKSELMDFIEAKLVERQNLNIAIQGKT